MEHQQHDHKEQDRPQRRPEEIFETWSGRHVSFLKGVLGAVLDRQTQRAFIQSLMSMAK
jgi:hypothetical protein